MNKQKRFFRAILLILGVAGMFYYCMENSGEWEESHSGIPDAVSSMSSNNRQYLKVVANSDRIDDKEAFARKVIQMCRENSFHTIRFSTDINGYPSGLSITVYLNRKDLEKGRQVCGIEFRTEGYMEDCNIKDDVEQFHLYLDGEEIEFIAEDTKAYSSTERILYSFS
ncbi:MAG: hypothetical protein HFG82_11770 [Dorea sp.]|nr:hypothetical protein [Dorea sp.]